MKTKITKENITTKTHGISIGELMANIEKGFKLQEVDSETLSDQEKLKYVNSILVAPDYQREYRYNQSDESSIIESVLIGIPIPPIFVAKNKMGEIHICNVIDGQHRLRAIYRFYENEYPLIDLKLLDKEYDGKYYKDLTLSEKQQFLSEKLSCIEFEKFPGLDVEIEIFNRYNKGTKPLTTQEIRHAVYNSKFNEYINYFSKDLSQTPENPLYRIYNITKDRIQKKKIQESIFIILSILENGVDLKLNKSPEYAEKFMKAKKELSNDEMKFEENFLELKKKFVDFNKFIVKIGEKIDYPFSREIYGVVNRNYKFQISTAMIISGIINKVYLNNKDINDINIDKFLEEISKKMLNSYLENSEYSASSTSPKEMDGLIQEIDIQKFL